MPDFRSLAVLLHRWAGLVLAGFLLVEGLTGSLIAFDATLDLALWPVLAPVARPAAGAEPLSTGELNRRLRARAADAVIDPPLPSDAVPAGGTVRAPVRYHRVASPAAASGAAGSDGADLGYRGRDGREEVYLDPYTGREIGRRHWGDLSEGMKNLMPFIHRLHNSLALGRAGSSLLGLVALLWTIDCFVGVYLTLPKGRPLLAKWRPAWGIQKKRLNLDLHRAGGLWLWALLFVFAWSSVGFEMTPLHAPLMRGLARALTGGPVVDAAGRDAVSGWMADLHTARIGGPAVQALVCALGLSVAGLATTGALVWSKKRRGRIAAARAAAARQTAGRAPAKPAPARPMPSPALAPARTAVAPARTALTPVTPVLRREHRPSPASDPVLGAGRRPNNPASADSSPPWPPTPPTPRTRTSQRPSAS